MGTGSIGCHNCQQEENGRLLQSKSPLPTAGCCGPDAHGLLPFFYTASLALILSPFWFRKEETASSLPGDKFRNPRPGTAPPPTSETYSPCWQRPPSCSAPAGKREIGSRWTSLLHLSSVSAHALFHLPSGTFCLNPTHLSPMASLPPTPHRRLPVEILLSTRGQTHGQLMPSSTSLPLSQRLANFFCKGPHSKYFRLARAIWSLSQATTPLCSCGAKAAERTHKQVSMAGFQ